MFFLYKAFYLPPTKLPKGNVFSRICSSVIPSTAGSLCDHYPWCIEPHCNSHPPSRPQPSLDTKHGTPWPWLALEDTTHATPLLVKSGGHHWRTVQTCWFENPPSPGATSGGGHWSTYGLQACGKHSSGILSCSENYRHQWSENSHLEAISWVQS